jgi:hypothetical protein
MAQSLSRVLVHFIFSTRDRFAFLVDSELRKRMHAYLARVFNEHDSPAIEVGGTEHHRQRTFQEEYLEFLRENQIPYDERYLWT